ncbi:MAG: nucleotidyltransferase domain-containing protein [Magnetococcales bacterium]|nr:nucleotidyltransferase domain-containing protein [Magnetococcales bacterium]MBF0114909.1 nucleotidyltransferase domain-containing protein [Magnetococcales bacterium]
MIQEGQRKEWIEEAVRRIVQEVDPERVILFGSESRGVAQADSDVDLLVIAEGEKIQVRGRRKTLAGLWRAMGRLPLSFDFLLFSPEEINRWEGNINHVIHRALQEGVVLYERG